MTPIIDSKIEEYAETYTTKPSQLLQELEHETKTKMEMPQMLTGTLEGRFLKTLVKMLGAKRAIEVGMFTGYGSLSIAEGLPENGELICLELDPKRIAFAKKYFERSPHGKKIHVMEGKGLDSLKKMEPPFDFIFIDADKLNYIHYYEEALRLVRSGGVIAVDNVLWSGNVLNPQDEETKIIHELNKKISKDSRVENVLITVRDGIQLVLKK